jgi:hypothetical protein
MAETPIPDIGANEHAMRNLLTDNSAPAAKIY